MKYKIIRYLMLSITMYSYQITYTMNQSSFSQETSSTIGTSTPQIMNSLVAGYIHKNEISEPEYTHTASLHKPNLHLSLPSQNTIPQKIAALPNYSSLIASQQKEKVKHSWQSFQEAMDQIKSEEEEFSRQRPWFNGWRW